MQIEIGKIEDYKFYTNKAYKRGSTRLKLVKAKGKTREDKYRYLEAIRLSIIRDTIVSDMQKIIDAMPRYNQLTDFYKKLFSYFLDVDRYKKSLASIKWANEKISLIFRASNSKISRSKKVPEVIAARNMFLARCESLLKQINENLKFLDLARRRIKEIPSIKSDMFTVAITGFPNVGKSTLIGKITDSKPEVNSYAFTTKGLMIGYVKSKDSRIQIIDTPGTLNRKDKMNNIEKMAHLCMKDVAKALVYVFDLSEPYPAEEQIKLYNNLKKLDKEIVIYFSKSDVLDKSLFEKFKIKGSTEPKEIKEEIIKWSLISETTCEDN